MIIVNHLIKLLVNSSVTSALISFKVKLYSTSVLASKDHVTAVGRTLISLPQTPDLTKMDTTAGLLKNTNRTMSLPLSCRSNVANKCLDKSVDVLNDTNLNPHTHSSVKFNRFFTKNFCAIKLFTLNRIDSVIAVNQN
ncbi:hypothetical protein [Colwellia sp. Arc7-635]|uniref:hypothetical protein n=1 Tax=Colwellia sp. Arc7-635 TaxID=2497879 RepID=UPI0019D0BBE2|nr:hypothetical protein [Colwellia sp. Arc7-635]